MGCFGDEAQGGTRHADQALEAWTWEDPLPLYLSTFYLLHTLQSNQHSRLAPSLNSHDVGAHAGGGREALAQRGGGRLAPCLVLQLNQPLLVELIHSVAYKWKAGGWLAQGRG